MGAKVRDMTIEDHIKTADLLYELKKSYVLINIIRSYKQNTRMVKAARKIIDITWKLMSDLEIEFFKEFPELVKIVDKEINGTASLAVYYGTIEARKKVRKYLKQENLIK